MHMQVLREDFHCALRKRVLLQVRTCKRQNRGVQVHACWPLCAYLGM